MIKKSFAGVAAGVLLVGGGAMATAQADPSQPSESTTVAAAPAQRTTVARAALAAPGYPASVFTRTRVNVPERVRAGSNPRVTITVTAGAIQRKPHGVARLVVDGKVRRAEVRRGEAVVRLPDLRGGRSYTARVSYKPTRGSQFKDSGAADRFRVVRRSR